MASAQSPSNIPTRRPAFALDAEEKRHELEIELFAAEAELSLRRAERAAMEEKIEAEELGAEIRNQQLRDLVEKQRRFLAEAKDHAADYERKRERLLGRLASTEDSIAMKEEYCDHILRKAQEVEDMVRRVQEAISQAREPARDDSVAAQASKKKKRSNLLTMLKSLRRWGSSSETKLESLTQEINEARRRNSALKASVNSALNDLGWPEKYETGTNSWRLNQRTDVFAAIGNESTIVSAI